MMRRFVSAGARSVAAVGCRWQSVPPRLPLHNYDSFLSGSSADYLDDLYLKWEKDPKSVDQYWNDVFTSGSNDRNASLLDEPLREASHGQAESTSTQTFDECGRLSWMIQAWEARGHLVATIDPLNLKHTTRSPFALNANRAVDKLQPESFGFEDSDLDKVYRVNIHSSIGGLLHNDTPPMTLRQLYKRLETTYGGNIGWEYMHITNADHTTWLRENIEAPERVPGSPLANPLTAQEKRDALKIVAEAQLFENFMHTKFVGQKRFGLDGGESLSVGLEALLQRATEHEVNQAVIGIAHRGRLNLLTNTMKKPVSMILKEFKGITDVDDATFGSYDVKYHLGYNCKRTMPSGKDIELSLLPNPSHLECVNPTVEGRCRAIQCAMGDNRERALPIEIHGDAAFSGQGVTFETMGLSNLGKYCTGGTIHIVINNQIGFTTDPKYSRSSPHCTDLGRIFHCPIFHVNGDSIEDVVKVFKLAMDFRQKFGKSVVIDLVCYRRYGHNESDDPSFTQPYMYSVIRQRENIFKLYGDSLVKDGTVTADDLKKLEKSVTGEFNKEFKKTYTGEEYISKLCVLEQWKPFKRFHEQGTQQPTAVTEDELAPVFKALTTVPVNFTVHKTIDQIIDRRRDVQKTGQGVDWGLAEALAFGTLLNKGTHVRVSGQDVERATFSQRHAVLHDQKSDVGKAPLPIAQDQPGTYTQLMYISEQQAKFVISNSSLSEFGVLGFETGYAMQNPHALVMWEAQFADFANTAQIIFDQFLFSAEEKWRERCGLIVSMPHGYDGNGPEHSSGRIERFLQAVNEDPDVITDPATRSARVNIDVTYPTTPAQYFHLLRAHVMRDIRKPKINFFSKAFLRHPNISTVSELTSGEFSPVLDDTNEVPDSEIKRVVFCTGQIYHHTKIAQKSDAYKGTTAQQVALVRIEQLAPFPWQEVQAIIEKYPQAEFTWLQEEPKNMGAYYHARPRLQKLLSKKLPYIGRPISASTATGFKKIHDREQAGIIRDALTL